MDFASSFFEKEPEFMVGASSTEDEGGGWPTAWGESASSSSSSHSTDSNQVFDPFDLPRDEHLEKERIKKPPRGSNNINKVSYYSVSVSSGGGGGSGSGSGSSSKSSSSRTCSSNSSAGGAGGNSSPLGPWRVDLDDSTLLNECSVSTTASKQQTQQHSQQQQQPTGVTTSLHCIVDLDDTALMESDDSEDDSQQQQQQQQYGDVDQEKNGRSNSNGKNTSKNHSSSATSSSSPTARTTTSATSNNSSAVSPIDPWRFDVDLCSTTSHDAGSGGLDHHYHDQLDDDETGPLIHGGTIISNRDDDDDDDDDVAGKSVSSCTADSSNNMHPRNHHHPLNCSSMDPWIEIVSINDESINKGGATAPCKEHLHGHPQQQQQRPKPFPQFGDHVDEGRDDSAGHNSSDDDDDDDDGNDDDYMAAAAAFQKNLKQRSPNRASTTGTSRRSSASPITNSHASLLTTTTTSVDAARTRTDSRRAVACVTPSPSISKTTLQQQQQQLLQQPPFLINEDSFGFAPFHALNINVTDGGNHDDDDDDDHGRNAESFREAIVFGLHDDPTATDGHHHRKDDTSFRSPPDNVDPFNSLAYENDDDDDDDESAGASAGFEESTAAHAVDHFQQDEDDVKDTAPPSFVKGRGFKEQQQADEDIGEDSDEVDEVVMVAEVQISEEEEDAFEVTATTCGGKAVAVDVAQTDDAVDTATAAAGPLALVVDDPPLQIVESVDDGDAYLQDQDDEDDRDIHHDDFNDERIYRPNRSETTSSADHGSGSGPASTSYSSWAETNTSSCSSCITSMEQSKHRITVIVAQELWSDDCKVVEMAMGTLHRILLRSILHDPQTDDNVNNINNTDNSPSRITESMSSNSGSPSSHKGGKANATSKRANAYKRNELIELAFCRGCPLAAIRAMKSHPTNTFLQDSGLCILNVFCWTGVATHVVEVGSLERAMAAIEQFQHMDTDEEKAVTNRRNNNSSRISKNSAGRKNKEGPEVVESAIYHIANLLRDKTLAARVIEGRGLEAIANAMKRLSSHADVQLAGCCAFRNLLQHQESTILERQWATKVVQVGAIDRVIAALDDHPGNAKLQLEGYKILRRLSILNEELNKNHGYISQSSDSNDGRHDERLSGCYFRTKNLDAPDFFATSFEI